MPGLSFRHEERIYPAILGNAIVQRACFKLSGSSGIQHIAYAVPQTPVSPKFLLQGRSNGE